MKVTIRQSFEYKDDSQVEIPDGPGALFIDEALHVAHVGTDSRDRSAIVVAIREPFQVIPGPGGVSVKPVEEGQDG